MPVAEIQTIDAIGQRALAEPLAAACRTRVVAAVAGEQNADVHLVALRLEPTEPGAQARVVTPAHDAHPLDDALALGLRELAPGSRAVDALVVAELTEHAPLPCALRSAPRSNGHRVER